MTAPAPFANALWLVLAIAAAGVFHVLWLQSPLSKLFQQPIDCGLTWRGRRLLGDNKKLRGLMAMPLAAAVTFSILGGLQGWLPAWLEAGTWNLSLSQYAALGFVCGLAFMLAELPNSFLKRQLGVPPGEAPRHGILKPVTLTIDRLDSVVGVLLVVSLLLPVEPATWLWVFLLGPATHAAFSVWLYHTGEKARAL